MVHISVLQKEVLQYLEPKPNENFIDCTIGEGGHTAAILEKTGHKGKILGIEADTELYQKLKSRMAEFPISNFQFSKRLILVNDNFVNLKEIVKREKFKSVSGILFDLGMSSWHLEESGRGFSFQKKEPLDMRYNPGNPLTPLEVNRAKQKQKENRPLTGLTAEKILNYWSEREIEKILREYGEEQLSQQIAKEIIELRKLRPIKNTFQLVEIIKKVVPLWYQHKKIHFATRTFQALRIAVNDELNNLKKALPQAVDILKDGGRLVVISFHSLEDRIVKNFFKNYIGITYVKLQILTKKPIRPGEEEIKINLRSRSAKLRAAIKLTSNKYEQRSNSQPTNFN